jgi:hypothetical protein
VHLEKITLLERGLHAGEFALQIVFAVMQVL